MDLLERYVASVAAALPAERAVDISREVRANLLDLLDEQAAVLGRPLTTAELTSYLEQQPHPQQLAQRYLPAPPLVSSEDMPLYRTVLWYSAALLAVLMLLKSLGALVQQDDVNPIRFIVQFAVSFIDDFAVLWLLVTAIFYSCARAGWTERWRQRRWQLAHLPSQPQARIGLTDLVADLTSSSFLLLLLWTPLWMSSAAQAQLMLMLAPDMQHWRWILTVLCAGSVLLALYRIYQRSWQRWTLALYIVELLAFAAVFIAMANTSTPVLLLRATGQGASWLQQQIVGLLDLTLATTAVVLLVLAAIELRRYYRLV